MPLTPTEHREDVRELHVKINTATDDLSYIRGMLDAKLPLMATRADVELAINNHEVRCNKHRKISRTPRPPAHLAKLIGAAVGAIGGLGAAIYALAGALGG